MHIAKTLRVLGRDTQRSRRRQPLLHERDVASIRECVWAIRRERPANHPRRLVVLIHPGFLWGDRQDEPKTQDAPDLVRQASPLARYRRAKKQLSPNLNSPELQA